MSQYLACMNGIMVPIAFLAMLGVSSVGQRNSAERTVREDAPKPPSEMDMYEAVLRYQAKIWEFAADSYCVEVNGKDPGSELLERLRALAIKPASACRNQITDRARMQVVDRETGRPSVIFRLGEIRWLNHSEAEVDGGYLCGSQCLAVGAYHVSWDGRRWVITDFQVRIET